MTNEVRADEAGTTGDEYVHVRYPLARRRRRCVHGRMPACAASFWPAAPAPGFTRSPSGQQAAGAGLRQADDLLPAVDTDPRRHPGHPRDHDPARRRPVPSGCSATARSSASASPTSPASPGRPGAGVHPRRGAHRQRHRSRSCWATTSSTARGWARGCAVQRRRRRCRLRLLGGRPDGVRRGRVRRRAAGPSRWRRSPSSRKSNYAVPGLYFYDNDVVEIAEAAEAVGPWRARDHRRQPGVPRARAGCRSKVLPRGTAWLDTGTFDSLSRGDGTTSARSRTGRG